MINRIKILFLLSFLVSCSILVKNTNEYKLIQALQSRHRNLTNIALWTLEKDGLPIPPIDFTKPYSQAEPDINELVDLLLQLPNSKLDSLDDSFDYHKSIYSPYYWDGGEGWGE